MGCQVDMSDRRLQRRFKAPCNAFAVIHSHTIIVTSLANINMDGLAFDFMFENIGLITGAKELDIFCADDNLYDFHLQNVPFEIVSKLEIESKDQVNPITTRYGVKFGNLTPEQESRLRFFIKYHTTDEAYYGATTSGSDSREHCIFDRISFVF